MEETKSTKEETSIGLDENIAAALSYIPILGLIFIFTEKKSKFVRFHSFQSLFLAVALFVLSILLGIVTAIPLLGLIFALLSCLVWIAVFVLYIFVMIKAYQKEMYKLPVIGDMAEKQANNPVA